MRDSYNYIYDKKTKSFLKNSTKIHGQKYWDDFFKNLGIVRKPVIKITNFDKLLCMSKEELAEYIFSSSKFCSEDCNGYIEDPNNPCSGRCDNKCYEHCLEWLMKEVK